MKILLTTDTWTPTVNGVVTSTVALRTELLARGHDVRVLTLAGSGRTFTEDGVTYLGSLDAGLIYPGARLRAPALNGALHALAAWQPDVVHSQCEFSTFAPARQLAKAAGAPLLHTYHTVYEDYTHYFSPSRRMGRCLAELFTRSICASCDAVIAPTRKIKWLLTGYGVHCPVEVIPTGLDLDRFAVQPDPALRRALDLPESEPVLLYLGRLAKEKNIAELIAALPQIARGVLLIVGDGPERATLEQLAEELGVAHRIRFAGMVAPADVPCYYALADAFVSASTSEAQGLTYIEALAAGLPLLCRDDPCVRSLITPGQDGWIYHTAEELAALANALPWGPAAEPLRQKARQAAAPYGRQTFGASVEALYRRTILDKTAAPRAARPKGVLLW
ncbi:glycosyltransferase [Subdoligranulum variabile]|uniref:Glycosyltransferase, group 1 family protein n=1 Tax=Subdoligranulum variabile DSM 15176 TaxID=411471 RepID=D1PIS6_9FIRM|nr:glycosyltransferase [Subdoligranulum variabile]EFB77435.1 glycosyltransferase, group 1 family protein [Subdoligranulum variabile DSM 15176]UWP67324.1 glycosyltransferase [Subdoligranulum variabile]